MGSSSRVRRGHGPACDFEVVAAKPATDFVNSLRPQFFIRNLAGRQRLSASRALKSY